jgi:hypothetical protein
MVGNLYFQYIRKDRKIMKQNNLIEIIDDQTKRTLWEVKNIIDCITDDYGIYN